MPGASRGFSSITWNTLTRLLEFYPYKVMAFSVVENVHGFGHLRDRVSRRRTDPTCALIFYIFILIYTPPDVGYVICMHPRCFIFGRHGHFP